MGSCNIQPCHPKKVKKPRSAKYFQEPDQRETMIVVVWQGTEFDKRPLDISWVHIFPAFGFRVHDGFQFEGPPSLSHYVFFSIFPPKPSIFEGFFDGDFSNPALFVRLWFLCLESPRYLNEESYLGHARL